jgi:hypothetical protein
VGVDTGNKVDVGMDVVGNGYADCEVLESD